MKMCIKIGIEFLKKRIKESSTKGFGLIEVVIASAAMVVVLLAIAQMQRNTGSAVLNAKLTSDFNTAITFAQSLINNSTNCQSMLSNIKLSTTSAGPLVPAQIVSPLLTSGATGASVLKLGPLGSNLNITNIEFDNVTPLASANQFLVNLHIAAAKVLPGGMVGNSTLTHDFPLVLQINPSAGNAITDCLGSTAGGVWQKALNPSDIYYNGNVSTGTNKSKLNLNVVGGASIGTMLVSSPLPANSYAGLKSKSFGILTGFEGDSTFGVGMIQDVSWFSTSHLVLQNSPDCKLAIGPVAAAPSNTLEVAGIAGLSTGTSWIKASDIRLKDILGDYEYGLKEVLQLHPVRFQYKKDNALKLQSDKKLVGFIAQEVQDIIPDAVHRNEENGYLDLNADPIHWALVKAIQELYALIQDWIVDEKKDFISDFKIENVKLKEEMASIKSYMCSKDYQASFCK